MQKTYSKPISIAVLLCILFFIPPARSQSYQQQNREAKPKIIRRSGRALEGKAVKRVEPIYPPLARAAKISGSVVVKVQVNVEGNVESAQAISGHPLLKDAAVEAAKQWKFTPIKLSRPMVVKVIGNLVFNFTLKRQKPGDETGEFREKSIAELEKQIKAKPDSDAAHFELGLAYLKDKQGEAAITEFKEVIRINPNYEGVYYQLGVSYWQASKPVEAQEALMKSLQLQPDYYDKGAVYFGLGMLHFKAERYEEAISNFKESLKSEPSIIDTHLGLGIAYTMIMNFKEAIASLNRVLELVPSHVEAHYWLGKAHFYTGDKTAALKEYEFLTKQNKQLAEELLKEIKGQ